MGGVGTFGVVACVQEVVVTPGELLADADLIHYTRGASVRLQGDIKRLHEAEAMYRLRMGDYRVLFDVEGGVIVIRRIGNRKDVYD